MAYCVSVPVPGGGTAIVRMSGKPPAPCAFCNRPHTKLCDAAVTRESLLKGHEHGTCDARLCDKCAISSGNYDFCPIHKDLA
jgi:hypothetical protein